MRLSTNNLESLFTTVIAIVVHMLSPFVPRKFWVGPTTVLIGAHVVLEPPRICCSASLDAYIVGPAYMLLLRLVVRHK
jgi:hypothetical protein